MGVVEGGMNFTQDDQHLVVPKCGYYSISSQVLFQYTASKNDPAIILTTLVSSMELRLYQTVNHTSILGYIAMGTPAWCRPTFSVPLLTWGTR